MRTNRKSEIIDLLKNNTSLFDRYTLRLYKKKGDFLLSAGGSGFGAFYLNEGITRNFLIQDGREITLQFNFPGDIVFPLNSYDKTLPNDEYIQALTELDFVKINLDGFNRIKQENTDLYELEIKINEIYTFQIAKRLRDFQTKTAKERYLELIKTEPQILQFCQLSHIASYLGINLGSLSRIRSEI